MFVCRWFARRCTQTTRTVCRRRRCTPHRLAVSPRPLPRSTRYQMWTLCGRGRCRDTRAHRTQQQQQQQQRWYHTAAMLSRTAVVGSHQRCRARAAQSTRHSTATPTVSSAAAGAVAAATDARARSRTASVVGGSPRLTATARPATHAGGSASRAWDTATQHHLVVPPLQAQPRQRRAVE